MEHVVKLLIEEAKEMLSKKENMKMRVLPMYGSLPMSEQVTHDRICVLLCCMLG